MSESLLDFGIPFGKLRKQAGISPCPIGNTSTHFGAPIIQPASCYFYTWIDFVEIHAAQSKQRVVFETIGRETSQ